MSKNCSLDLLARYTLVAVPDECTAVQEQCMSDKYSHLAPVTPKDHRAMANLLARRLPASDENSAPIFSIRHCGFMLLQFIDGVKAKNAYELLVPIIQASFEFFWWVFVFPETLPISWRDIATYAPGAVLMFR